MSPEEFHQKQLIRSIIEHPLWPEIRKTVRQQIMESMMSSKSSDERNELFYEAQALDRLVGRLTAIANEVRLEVAHG